MAQINKYATQAAYAADTTRSELKSAVSEITATGKIVYDGVNCLAPIGSSAFGDLVVYDSIDAKFKVIKAGTYVAAQRSASLTPLAAVYGRQGDIVKVCSLATQGSAMWGHSYQVLLSGISSSATSIVFTIGGTAYTVSFSAGAAASAIASAINSSAVNSMCKWTATVNGSNILMTYAYCSATLANITAATNCTITYPTPNTNYLTSWVSATSLGSSWTQGTVTWLIRKNGGVDTSWAGANLDQFYYYYSTHGSTSTNVGLGSSDLIQESVFTAASNPILYNKYGTYKNYLLGEHFAKWPCKYRAMNDDRKTLSNLLASVTFTDCLGNTNQSAYPAAAMAAAYGVTVSGVTTGLEAGKWWLPSPSEFFQIISNVKKDGTDDLSKTLSQAGGIISPTSYYWLSSEYDSNTAWVFGGTIGYLNGSNKYNTLAVRPVSDFKISEL